MIVHLLSRISPPLDYRLQPHLINVLKDFCKNSEAGLSRPYRVFSFFVAVYCFAKHESKEKLQVCETVAT